MGQTLWWNNACCEWDSKRLSPTETLFQNEFAYHNILTLHLTQCFSAIPPSLLLSLICLSIKIARAKNGKSRACSEVCWWIHSTHLHHSASLSYQWTILDASIGEFYGHLGYWPHKQSHLEQDVSDQTCWEIIICLHPLRKPKPALPSLDHVEAHCLGQWAALTGSDDVTLRKVIIYRTWDSKYSEYLWLHIILHAPCVCCCHVVSLEGTW